MKNAFSIDVLFIIDSLGEAEGNLIRFLSPRTVEALVRSLPLEGRAALTKGGLYFPVPINLGVEKAKRTVEKGVLAYWPMGRALCIFYEDAKPYSPVNYVGKITKNLEIFRKVKTGMKIVMKKM
ncbi:hypothetical protein DRO35_03100 [Candidatus Bathyarchaeota archaeon]|mgnify:CR=1 FL=1|nr:MAG: hypothetical protein DRO35_03100 [Candidatus Bathyarchaeota archaeon]